MVAVLLGIVFIVVFVVSVTSCFAVAKAADKKFVPDLLDTMDAYNFVYDDVLDAVLEDAVSGAHGFSMPDGGSTVKLSFQDPARAKAALRKFVETIVPREYVRQEITQALAEVQPYITGRTDKFLIDLETDQRILRIPDALRLASAELSLGQLISEQVIGVIVRDRVDELVFGALGITLTSDEAVAAANRIMPPEWIEQRIFETADAVAPYFAGRKNSFEIRIDLKDRVKVLGEELKAKLVREDIATTVVFEQVAKPLINQALGGLKALSFDITITPEEVDDALRQVLPPEWVRQQGNDVIDAVVAYLTSNTERLQYSVDLRERKASAVTVLRDLAKRKLTQIANKVPGCVAVQDNVQAGADLLALKIPTCRPLNLSGETIVGTLFPLVQNDLDRLVVSNIPDRVTYTEADLRAALGVGAIKTLEDVRDRLQKGVVFTEQDMFANINDPQARADVEDVIAKVRAGARWDQSDILDRMDPAERQSFDDVRHWSALVIEFRWLGALPAALFLIVIGLLGGRSWSGRFLWAGLTLTAVALIFFIAVQVASGNGISITRDEFGRGDLVNEEFRADFPATARLLESDKFEEKAAVLVSVVAEQYRDAAIPWLAAGLGISAVAIALRVLRGPGKKKGTGGGSRGPLNLPPAEPGLPAR